MAADPDTHTVYVTNGDDNTVSVIDAKKQIVTATVPVGKKRREWRWTRARQHLLHQRRRQNGVGDRRHNAHRHRHRARRQVPRRGGGGPGTHTVYVTNNTDDTVSVIDAATRLSPPRCRQ